MPGFCHFWGYTPEQFRALTMRDYRDMSAYQREAERELEQMRARVR